MIPFTTPPVWPEPITPGRFASLVRRDSPSGCAIGLLGLPDDTGVSLNNGRPGARDGPRAFREALAKFGVSDPAGGRWPQVFDAGDVMPGGNIHVTHQRVTEAAGAIVDAGLFPIAVGGGHDLTFPFVRALSARARGPLAGVYADAHLDVRETVGSGMPFRKLVEECRVERLMVFGLLPFVNSAEHVAWFESHGGRIAARSTGEPDLNGFAGAFPTFASFDMDVLDAAYAPGVSALNPAGWTSKDAEAWVRAAGACRQVRCFDIMELNPVHDVNGQTARLAAMLFLTFLRGYAERPA